MVKAKRSISEKILTKGELRKLNALRKSIGDQLGEEAFAKWYEQESRAEVASDPNVDLIEKALSPLMKEMRIPRGGAYAIRRGRGRFIVEPIEMKG